MKYRIFVWFLFLTACLILSYFHLINFFQYTIILIIGAILHGLWIWRAYKKSQQVQFCDGCNQPKRVHQINLLEGAEDFENGYVEWILAYCKDSIECQNKVMKLLDILLAQEEQRRNLH